MHIYVFLIDWTWYSIWSKFYRSQSCFQILAVPGLIMFFKWIWSYSALWWKETTVEGFHYEVCSHPCPEVVWCFRHQQLNSGVMFQTSQLWNQQHKSVVDIVFWTSSFIIRGWSVNKFLLCLLAIVHAWHILQKAWNSKQTDGHTCHGHLVEDSWSIIILFQRDNIQTYTQHMLCAASWTLPP